MSTIDGGMIWPSVPAAAMEPDAKAGSYPRFSIVGRLSNPMVTTVAPTMPVEAASSAPTIVTDMPSPPRRLPNSFAISSSSSSAIFAFSRIAPIKMNIGTAISVELVIAP